MNNERLTRLRAFDRALALAILTVLEEIFMIPVRLVRSARKFA